MSTCNILVKKGTREKLKHLGKMTQTYDDLINELIEGRLSPIGRKDWILEGRNRPFKIKDAQTPHRKNENQNMPVAQSIEHLVQQGSGGQED